MRVYLSGAGRLSGSSADSHIAQSEVEGAGHLPVILILSQRVVVGVVGSSLSDARVQRAGAVLDVVLGVLQTQTHWVDLKRAPGKGFLLTTLWSLNALFVFN